MSPNPTEQTATRFRGGAPAPQLRLLPPVPSDIVPARPAPHRRRTWSARALAGVAVVVAAVGVLGARVALRRRRSRRAVEASRNRAFADLLTAVRQRDEALAQASHDLKTPLTALKGQAQLLQRLLRSTETPDADRMRAGLATIDAAATAAAERVDRLVEGADSKPAKGTSGR